MSSSMDVIKALTLRIDFARELRQWNRQGYLGERSAGPEWPDLPGFLFRFAAKVAFYEQESDRLSLRKASTGPGKRPWKVSPKENRHLQSEGAKALMQNRALQSGAYWLVPAYRQEQTSEKSGPTLLPLGVWVFASEHLQEEERDLLEIFCRFYSLHVAARERLKQIKEEEQTISFTAHTLQEAIRDERAQDPGVSRYAFLYEGKSPAMASLRSLLRDVIRSNARVLIVGENGTGKERLARMIHEQGPLGSKPFVSIHCGTFNRGMIESQLFGHVEGAFSGATSEQIGLIEMANGGTLFLEEIGEMPLDLQAKLLRVLEEGEVVPLGSSQVRKVDIRVLSSSQHNLEELVQNGTFRKDLFFRLGGIMLPLPPLRHRKEDIPHLVEGTLKEICRRLQKPKKRITTKALHLMSEARWPGNIRQLENTLEMLVALISSRRIDVKHLPLELRGPARGEKPLTIHEAKKVFFKRYVEALMQKSDGKLSRAATLSGLHRVTLYRLIQSHARVR